MKAQRRVRRTAPGEILEQRIVLDASYFDLGSGNLSQDWSNPGLLTTNDDWSNVPSIVGFRGDELTTATAVNPQTVLSEGTPVIDVNVNNTNGTFATGGVTEFAIANPVVGLTGSGTADAPYILLHVNTTNREDVSISYLLRDIDGSTDNAVQAFALQYRVGTTGNFTNVPGGFVADASSGPSLATLTTNVSVTLPAAVNNQGQVQLRIITTNAVGNDEYVGIDDIVVSSTSAGGDTTPPTVISVDDGDSDDSVLVNETLTYTVTFDEDIDGATVTAADFSNSGTSAITIGMITETSAGVFSVQVTPTSAGTLILQIPNGTVISDIAGNALAVPVVDDTTVTVTANDTTPPTVSTIDDGDADNLVATGVELSYTITFSEDIDAATVTSADFTNAGTSTITIGAITETSPGIFTVAVTPVTGGTLNLQIPSGSVIQDVAGNALAVPVADDDTLTVDATLPQLVSIADNVSGGPVSQGQAVTYTVTFDEDIDSTTVTSADFDNAGTATISVGTITETSAGVFNVLVTPTSSGSLTLRIPSLSVISDIVGNSLAVPVLDDTTITVSAVTSLAAGDVAVIGYNTSGSPDSFTIVVLKELIAGTSFIVNDNEISADGGAAFTDLSEGEATFRVKPGQTVAAGTVLSLPWGAAAVSESLYDWSSTTGFGLGSNNEEIYLYTASSVTSTTPTEFIYGVAIGSSPSQRPGGLTAGTSFIEPTGTASRYKTTGAVYSDTQENLLIAIGDTANNWEGVAPVNNSDWTFNVGSDTTPPTVTFDDGDLDDSVLTNGLLTYTLTFSEDILDGTLTAADLNNAGTASITFGTITEISPGVFTVEVTPTTAGTLILRIASDAVVEDVSGNDLVVPVQDDTTVTVTASDTTPPVVNSIDDNEADDLLAVGQDVTYTITFSEDIDDTTVTAADFVNSGTASVVIGAIAETSAGVFTVVVTPSSGGTLILQIPAGSVIHDVSGNALAVPVTDSDTLTVDATAPELTSIVDSLGGGTAFPFVPVIFTVTFNEDVNGVTVTASDFDNAGTADISVGNITESNPGIFTVSVTPLSAGTLRLRIPTGSVISDVAGNNLSVPLQDDTLINVAVTTTLSAGDVAFTGIQTDAPDTFSFVLLKDVAAGTTISFSDNGWSGDAFIGTSENTATIGFNTSYSAGTHFVISDNSGTAVFRIAGTTTSAGSVAGNLSGLSASGDSILAYQGLVPASGSATNWIAGISTRSFAALPSGTNQSDLPSALQVGVNAIQLSNSATDIDNGAYTRSAYIGTVDQIRSSVNNVLNWTTNNNPGPVSTTQFTVGVVSTEFYISEVVFDPTATTDTGEEYLELRGTPGTYVPTDVYLVLLEGDSVDGNGNLDHIFFIGGMQFGSGGFLVLRQAGSTFVVDSGATDVVATGTGWGTTFSSRTTDIENGSVSVLIIQASTAPVADTDVDANDDGTIDGTGSSWTVYDALGNIDGGASDTGYGFLNTSGNGNGLVPAGSTFVNLNGYHPDYMARNGSSTGYILVDSAATEWVVGELAGTAPNFTLATGGFTRPAIYEGAALNHLGAVNNFAAGNQAPVAVDDSLTSIAEDSGDRTISIASLVANDMDVDLDSLTITSVSNAVGGTVSIVGSNVVFVPTLNFNGTASFDYTLSDGSLTDTGSVSFAITAVNDVPTNILLSNNSVSENAGTNAPVGNLSATDPDTSETFTFSLPTGLNDNSFFNIDGTSLRATSSLNFEAKSSYTVTVRVTDAGGLTFDKQFVINVTDINESTFNSNVFFSLDAAAEKNFSLDQTGQRSMVRRIQIVFDGDVAIPVGAITNGSFVVNRLGASPSTIGLEVLSRSFAAGRTTVVLRFTSGLLTSESLADGNYRLVINYGVLGIDGDGNGTIGGTRTVSFHRFFGDSDGDLDVDSRDAANYRSGMLGNTSWRSVFDSDNDGFLTVGGVQDQQDKDAFFASYGRRLSPL